MFQGSLLLAFLIRTGLSSRASFVCRISTTPSRRITLLVSLTSTYQHSFLLIWQTTAAKSPTTGSSKQMSALCAPACLPLQHYSRDSYRGGLLLQEDHIRLFKRHHRHEGHSGRARTLRIQPQEAQKILISLQSCLMIPQCEGRRSLCPSYTLKYIIKYMVYSVIKLSGQPSPEADVSN